VGKVFLGKEMKRYRQIYIKTSFAFVFSLMLFLQGELFAKVRLLTFHFNKPSFIEMQYKTLQKFLKDDFELIVFNDAINPKEKEAIEEMCNKYEIKCVRFEPEWHLNNPLNVYLKTCLENPTIYSHVGFTQPLSLENISIQPSVRHYHVIQYALDNYGYNHDDIVAIMDGDAFLIRPLSLRNLLDTYDIIGIQKMISTENIDYLWVVFVAFNPCNLSNAHGLKFHLDVINGKLYDSGAHSYHYLNDHPSYRIKKYLGQTSTGFYHWDEINIQHYGFNTDETWLIKNLPWPQSVEFHLEKHFLHFGASSFELEGHHLKEDYVKEFIKRRLAD
jgi:hypothetical protein